MMVALSKCKRKVIVLCDVLDPETLDVLYEAHHILDAKDIDYLYRNRCVDWVWGHELDTPEEENERAIEWMRERDFENYFS